MVAVWASATKGTNTNSRNQIIKRASGPKCPRGRHSLTPTLGSLGPLTQSQHRSSPPASLSEPPPSSSSSSSLLSFSFSSTFAEQPRRKPFLSFSSPVSCLLCLAAGGYHPMPPQPSSSPPYNLALWLSAGPCLPHSQMKISWKQRALDLRYFLAADYSNVSRAG
ncbi:hypothetical protein Ahy_B02g061561 isoform D [Arachis hypogaea]|uniref:Uncharacterized protein n=1 Tax=Arachis hypogaea TaxID=3818 RepID=A0A445AL92_ARAHY|nr:hypothetical protein Ahy_B02g061561 isoform D [Arachis hypogaea]